MTDSKPDYPPIRRIITGHDSDDVAKVLIDSAAGNAKYPAPGTVSTLIWSTDSSPARIPVGTDVEDMGARILGTAPPKNGTRFAVIDFPPGNKPHMHRTETIDYVIVLEGEIEMDMDDSTVKMKAGEIMVVGHNPGMESLFLILADKKPAGIAGEKFPTCALAVLDFAIDDWHDVAPGAGMLARFLTPADL